MGKQLARVEKGEHGLIGWLMEDESEAEDGEE